MAEYIPFITSPTTSDLAQSIYSKAERTRVSLDLAEKITLPKSEKLWIDPGVDGLDNLAMRRPRPDRKHPERKRKTSWYEMMESIAGFEEIGDPTFGSKPDMKVVKRFVTQLLDRCMKLEPSWITVPQLPVVSGSSRNRINRALAKATGEWKSSRNFKGRFILPIIFTHQNQLDGKMKRNPKVALAAHCYSEARADGFWVVDQSLTDDSGSQTLRKRFPALIDLHEELNDKIPSRIRIAGPYWGMNLVLWAKNLIDYPAIGVGAGYQYFLAGSPSHLANARVAIAPLRRRIIVKLIDPLHNWLQKAILVLGPSHPSHKELLEVQKYLAELQKHQAVLNDPDIARDQVAKFYKTWFELIEQTPPAGRSLALFQDLSKAYALGKSLHARAKSLPKQPDIKDRYQVRSPEAVVEPLMLSCL